MLTWDPRGFGDSGGDVELDSPAYEARDVSALIDRIARQPQAQLDASGDPRLGMVGARGGWGSLLTALGVQGSATGGILGGLEGEPAGTQVGDMQDPRIYTAFQDGLATGEFTPADQAFFAAAGPAPLLGHIHIPVLLMQGTDHTLFTLHESITNYMALRADGVPVQMLWFCGSLSDDPGVAHGQCLTPKGPDPQLTLHFELRWLARYLKADSSVDTGPGLTWISDAGVQRTAASFPPTSGAPVTGSGSGTLPLAVGDTSGELIVASRAANAVNVALPTPVTLDGQAHTLTIPLEAVAADVAPGSSYTLQITDGTSVYFPARSAGLVNLSKISLSVPTVAPGASGVVTGVTTTQTGTRSPGAHRFSCAAPTGRIARRSLGPVSLGMTRARARRAFTRSSMF